MFGLFKKKTKKRMTVDLIRIANTMFRSGVMPKDIAEELDVDIQTLYPYLRESKQQKESTSTKQPSNFFEMYQQMEQFINTRMEVEKKTKDEIKRELLDELADRNPEENPIERQVMTKVLDMITSNRKSPIEVMSKPVNPSLDLDSIISQIPKKYIAGIKSGRISEKKVIKFGNDFSIDGATAKLIYHRIRNK